MKITAIDVDGFGVWRGLKLNDLSSQVTVFYGPNEAGKTTLLEFVRCALFGCSNERQRRYLDAVAGNQVGGSLWIEGSRGRFKVQRSFARARLDDSVPASGPTAGGGRLEISAAGGARQPEGVLRTLLGNVDETVFNNVFAVGLRELQELGTLTDSAAGDLLYGLSTGVDRVSLLDVSRELKGSHERLLSPDGRGGQIGQLLSDRERLRGELASAQSQQGRYAHLARARDELEREITRREQELAEWQVESGELELAHGLRDKWRARGEFDRQLAALGSAPRIGAKGLAQLDEVNRKIVDLRARHGSLRGDWQRLRQEATALGVDRELVRQSTRLEALTEQRELIGTLEQQAQELGEQIRELESQLVGHVRRPLAATDGKSPANLTPHLLGQLKSAARMLRRRRRQWGQLRTRCRSASKELAQDRAWRQKFRERRAARLARVSRRETEARAERERRERHERQSQDAAGHAPRDRVHALVAQGHIGKAVEEAGRQVALLRRRVQLEARLDEMSRHRRELEEQTHDAYEENLLPPRLLWGLGALVIGGLTLIMAGQVFPTAVTGTLGWTMTLLGFCGLVAGGATKFWIESQAAEDSQVLSRQLRMAEKQQEQAQRERDDLDTQLPRGGGPLMARLQDAEERLAELESQLPAAAPVLPVVQPAVTRRRTRRGMSRLQRQRAARIVGNGRRAHTQLKKSQQRWVQLLTRATLPADFLPTQLKELETPEIQASEIRERLFGRREELAQRRRALDDLAAKVRQLLPKKYVRHLDEGDLSLALVRIHDAIGQQRGLLGQRRILLRRREELVAERQQLQRTRQLWRRRRQGLFKRAQVRNEETFRRRWQDQVRADQVRVERDHLSREIVHAVAGRMTDDRLRQLLDQPGHDTLERQWESCTQRVTDSQHELRERYERRGELNQQLKALAEDRQMALRQLDLNVVEQRLRLAVERWQTLAVTQRVLDRVRGHYERERQPETLQEASRFLERLTEGRYVRVWTPLDEQTLFVETPKGARRRVDELSRGTREQLFVSLRLALVAAFGRRGVQVPLVLDDLFVNFDDQRAAAAAKVICEFADEGHQALVFTCHEHIANLFEDYQALVRELPARDGVVSRRRRAVPVPVPPVVIAPPALPPVPRPVRSPRRVPAPAVARSQPPRPSIEIHWPDALAMAYPDFEADLGDGEFAVDHDVSPRRVDQSHRLYRAWRSSAAVVEDELVEAWESAPEAPAPTVVPAAAIPPVADPPSHRLVRDEEEDHVLRWRWVWVNPEEGDAQDFAGEFSERSAVPPRGTEWARRRRSSGELRG